MTTEELSVYGWLEEHVKACVTEIECTTECSSAVAESSKTEKWQSAQTAARVLCDYYMSYTQLCHDEYLDQSSPSAHMLMRIAFQKRVVMCTVNYAQTESSWWSKAVDLCWRVRRNSGHFQSVCLTAVDHCIAVAVAESAGDQELFELQTL